MATLTPLAQSANTEIDMSTMFNRGQVQPIPAADVFVRTATTFSIRSEYDPTLTITYSGSGITYSITPGGVTVTGGKYNLIVVSNAAGNVYQFTNFSDILFSGDPDITNIFGPAHQQFVLSEDDNLTGGGVADFLDGFAGDDVINGGGGADVLRGNAGSDQLNGGTGDDKFVYKAPAEIGASEFIDGGAGFDRLRVDFAGVYDFRPLGDNVQSIEGVEFIFGTSAETGVVQLNSTQFAAANASVTGSGRVDVVDIAIPTGGPAYSAAGWQVTGFTAGVDSIVFRGNAANNGVTGSSFGDVIFGGGGTDNLKGGDGNDAMYGGELDAVTGAFLASSGGDFMAGDAGNDRMWGMDGNDWMTGDDGNDTLIGGAGNDQMSGDAGDDFVFGGEFATNGSFAANSGADTINGGDGADAIWGMDGADAVGGGEGNDKLTGGAGDDTMDGDEGDDFLFGGDFVNGTFGTGSGNDTLTGGDGRDAIYGFDGDDLIITGSGNDYVEGGEGADGIVGGSGDSFLQGGGGADAITGGGGFDYLYGNAGADLFNFRAGDSYDWVMDFSAAQGDRLRLDPGFGITSFAQFQAAIVTGSNFTQLTVNGGLDQITLFGIGTGQWTASMVEFA